MSTRELKMDVDEWQYKIPVTSNYFGDIDAPWQWCRDNLTAGTWSFDISNSNVLAVVYYFKSKDDATRFNLTYG